MINKESINLHNDILYILSHPKQKILINSVMFKLFENNDEQHYQTYTQINEPLEISLYERILQFIFCRRNINDY